MVILNAERVSDGGHTCPGDAHTLVTSTVSEEALRMTIRLGVREQQLPPSFVHALSYYMPSRERPKKAGAAAPALQGAMFPTSLPEHGRDARPDPIGARAT